LDDQPLPELVSAALVGGGLAILALTLRRVKRPPA